MSKPGARRYQTDDFAVEVDGVTYHPHEGEWVDIVGKPTVGEMRAYMALAKVGTALNAAKGEPDEAMQRVRILDDYFEMVCQGLARRIVDWSWTDAKGTPLPAPDGNAAAFAALDDDELRYLVDLSKGETAAQRGNALRPLPITSSATRSPGTAGARPTTGRSRTRTS